MDRSADFDDTPDAGRRKAIGTLGALGVAGFLAPALADAATPPRAVGCTLIAQETAGPFPLLEALSNRAIVRRDITEGRSGVPLALQLSLVDVARGCAPIAGAAVYVWHCDREGAYSGYEGRGDASVARQTFLRGVQVSDAAGRVRFDTIYPGWYPGRVTHVHVQVYLHDDLRGRAMATSQLAFPDDVTRAVYASPLYAAHGQNTSVRRVVDDFAFADGAVTQMLDVTGSAAEGYRAVLAMGVSA
ncbi:MAG: intradiol ring-cleavage dioxygenase [Rhodocyclaceae bacterium]